MTIDRILIMSLLPSLLYIYILNNILLTIFNFCARVSTLLRPLFDVIPSFEGGGEVGGYVHTITLLNTSK